MKKLCILLVVVLMLSLFAGCTKKADENVIRIGVNYELSGNVAAYGQSSVAGIEFAIEEINKAGGIDGKKIKIVKVDNKSEEAEATTLTTRLMTNDKVVAVLGPATSGAFSSTIPVASQNKIPVISGSATADKVTVDDKGNVQEYAFRICFLDSAQGTAMALFAYENLEKTKAVIIKDNSSDYGKGLAENFTKKFEDLGGTIVAEEGYVKGDTDFNAILTSIKGQDFDVIFIPGYYEEAGLIIKQARQQGIDAPIIGPDGFDSPDLVKLAGAENLNDVYFSNHYSSLDDTPIVQNFINSFKEKHGKEPDAFNALGYDAAKFLIDGIKRAEELKGDAIKDALEATTDFEGVTGTFSINEKHNPEKSIIVIGLKDGAQHSSVRVEYK